MAISLTRYVDIVSGVGAGAAVADRDLIGRFFTQNPLVPTSSQIEFTSADEVGSYFGTDSEEYARAIFYFGWVSKNITRAQKISFARWTPTATAPMIFGAKGAQSITTWNAITNGGFNLDMGAFSHAITGLNFSASANLAAVAAIIQAAIRAESYPVNFTGAIAITYPTVLTASISTTTMTVTAAAGAPLAIGTVLSGAGVTGGTTITALGTGTGGTGTYTVSASQTVSSGTINGGAAFNTLTVTNIDGILALGMVVAGSGVTGSPTITAFLTGTGGNGTYQLSSNSLAISAEAMTAGATTALWSAATVNFDAIRQSFNLTGGATGVAEISVTAGTGGTDIASQLGWLSPSAIFSDGAAIQTVAAALTESADATNNFGSFAFMPALGLSDSISAATWNLARNNQFMYSWPVSAANAASYSAALLDIGGNTGTLSLASGEYPEQEPMMILAATDYTAPNSTQNYMFNIFDLTPSVATDADADIYDALRLNYYGQTQTAGQIIQFYQRGVMMGLPVDPADQNTYANEIWLKDACGAAIMTLLLALGKVSANSKGRSQILAVLQGAIDQALFNGTISVGKTLNTVQKLYITEITNDPNAWQQVQNIGYWRDVVITPYVESNVTKYKAVYTLVYSKDDIIRKVEGRDILI